VFCPECGSEFRPGFRECIDCGVALVESPPEPRAQQQGDRNAQLVSVFESSDQALIALAQSLLESANIPFMTRGEGVQDLFGWGRAAGGFSVITGPVTFQVNKEDANDAHALLEDLEASEPDSLETDSLPEDDAK
jgi:Putative prokaryotic signal transducing protein